MSRFFGGVDRPVGIIFSHLYFFKSAASFGDFLCGNTSTSNEFSSCLPSAGSVSLMRVSESSIRGMMTVQSVACVVRVVRFIFFHGFQIPSCISWLARLMLDYHHKCNDLSTAHDEGS